MHLCAIYETNKDHAFGVTSLPTCLFWPITILYSCISFFKTHPFILCRVIPYYGGGGVELISARFWTFYFLFLPAITPKSLLHLLNISPPPLNLHFILFWSLSSYFLGEFSCVTHDKCKYSI